MTLQNKRLLLILLSVSLLLLIPFIAMHFTNQVNWSFFDFITMGILLLSTGLIIEFFFRKVKNRMHQFLLLLSVLLLFFLIWAELAVGLFGTPFAGN